LACAGAERAVDEAGGGNFCQAEGISVETLSAFAVIVC